MKQNTQRKIIIVGGGFAGVRCALDLAKKRLPHTKIILISNKPHFEYTPSLYKVVTGRSPFEVCIPLAEIFADTDVEVVEDSIAQVDFQKKKISASSGSHYFFDYLILALGSETAYFNIPGLIQFSFGFKSIDESLKLKRHLHELFEKVKNASSEKKNPATHILVVGGGPTGCELAGEISLYARRIAKMHGLDGSLVTVDLIEAAQRLLPALPEHFSYLVENRLRQLGVNIFLNRALVEREIEEVHLKDMEMKTKTLIWTAGVKPNSFYATINGLKFDKKGRVLVDDFLRARGWKSVFVLGDAAATPHSGLAQTAIHDGHYVASAVAAFLQNKKSISYKPRKVFYVLPIGGGWAAGILGPFFLRGRLGWWIRQLIDFRFFLSILPLRKALLAFQDGKKLTENCSVCCKALEGEI